MTRPLNYHSVFSCRPALEDLSHHSALEGMGFIALFLPSCILEAVQSNLQISPRCNEFIPIKALSEPYL